MARDIVDAEKREVEVMHDCLVQDCDLARLVTDDDVMALCGTPWRGFLVVDAPVQQILGIR